MVDKIFQALSPKARAVLLACACLLYILSPIDVIPDLTPFLGWVDDLIVAAVTLAMVWRRLRPAKAKAAAAPGRGSGAPDPAEVLGVRPGARPEEIRKAYREMMAQYHPDKVAHLGPELKETALRKTLEIQAAYERFLEQGT
ncbi:MAG: DUF1232 domain-containing protein [Elusimicrobia bacterium]|nr:DUF1232 domain-containing protein [Elusimicrobiota bacterium]